MRFSRGIFFFYHIPTWLTRPQDFLVVGVWINIFYYYPRDHELFSWWMAGTPLSIFHNETTRFSRGGYVGQASLVLPGDHENFSWWMCMTTFYFSPRDHKIFSWRVCVTIFWIFTTRPRDYLVVDVHDNILFLTMRPQDFLVVVVCDNIFNFHHETTRSSRGGCVGNLFLFLPGDHEIFSWWICATAFFSFTRRPQDFLVVDVHDNFLFFTMRPRYFLVVGLCDNIFNFCHETMYYQVKTSYCWARPPSGMAFGKTILLVWKLFSNLKSREISVMVGMGKD